MELSSSLNQIRIVHFGLLAQMSRAWPRLAAVPFFPLSSSTHFLCKMVVEKAADSPGVRKDVPSEMRVPGKIVHTYAGMTQRGSYPMHSPHKCSCEDGAGVWVEERKRQRGELKTKAMWITYKVEYVKKLLMNPGK